MRPKNNVRHDLVVEQHSYDSCVLVTVKSSCDLRTFQIQRFLDRPSADRQRHNETKQGESKEEGKEETGTIQGKVLLFLLDRSNGLYLLQTQALCNCNCAMTAQYA